MGSPELPGESNEEDLRPSPMHIINQGGNNSDDSDGEDGNEYDGYQPLPITDQGDDSMEIDNNLSEPLTTTTTNGDPNFPNVESIDAEVEREVWSQPRPQELDLELDSSRTEQIMSAMAGITLPNVAIPDWAQGVPEERWKEDLLERIRQRKDISPNSNTTSRRTS
ncbi:uncharacterized protein LOC129949966 [Eupeodes corollae]|uniref:uncharacterized protein LOC129949966 n=1 Tax=Eupeodes corollae TaxID=290404 RepID=UPI00248FB5B2|nr:uncharacterized protein LOC129949966 [Eupeodes corollae]